MLPCGTTSTGPTPENGQDGVRFDIEICSFLKAVRLMRLSVAPPSIKKWYNLTLEMVGEMISGSYPAPVMFLGQSEASKPIDVSIHLWCGAAPGEGPAAATARRRILTTHQDVMS
jgi:hypothetical protein